MATPTITIPLDTQTARAYDSAPPEQKRKIQALLSLWLRELAAGEYPSLQQGPRRGRPEGERSWTYTRDVGFPPERRVVAPFSLHAPRNSSRPSRAISFSLNHF